jgi:hypothetical protein
MPTSARLIAVHVVGHGRRCPVACTIVAWSRGFITMALADNADQAWAFGLDRS